MTLTLPEGGWAQLSETDLGLTAGFEGWLRVESDQAPVLGSVTSGQPTHRHYESTLPLSAGGLTAACFAQVAQGRVGDIDYFTGLAILNPHPTPVEIAIGIFHPDGFRNGQEVRRTLAAGEKYVRLLPFLGGWVNWPTWAAAT